MTEPERFEELQPGRIRPAAAPAARLLLLEPRAFWELGALSLASPWLSMVPQGDGHPVLVLPGFMANDRSTLPLRFQLRQWGYYAHNWRLGRNMGPTRSIRSGLIDRFDAVFGRQSRKVSLIGWSLGGVYARILARRFPDQVRQVITLGSPYRMRPQDRSHASALFEALIPYFRDLPDLQSEHEQPILSMPATSIYSRTDGIVRWHLCIDDSGPQRENIEVYSSHTGLGFNPSVLYAVGDRLAQAEGEWRPFRPPAVMRRLYPKPVWYEEARRLV